MDRTDAARQSQRGAGPAGGAPGVGDQSPMPTEDDAGKARLLFERVADAMADILCVLDLARKRIDYVNKSVGQVLGYVPADVEAFDGDLLERFVHPDDRARLADHIARCAGLPDDVVVEHEHRLHHADGSYRWLRSRTVVFSRASDGAAGQVLCLSRDVTEQRRTDRRLHEVEQQVQVQVESALRQRDEFLAVAAHELKTPIASLKGFAQLELRRLQRPAPPDRERIRSALDTIRSQADRLTLLVNSLLDVERLASGRLVLEPSDVDLAALVRSAATAFATASDRHTMQLRLAATLIARVDALRVEQVLTSLLDNAVKYSPDGGAVEVSLTHSPLDTARLEVRDHGVGILPERRAGIFERFAPAQPAAAGTPSGHDVTPGAAAHGLGLSLHVSRQIVELHDGTIAVESPPGGGTRFVVTLPIAGPSAA